jgi:hypothetical protein
MAHWRQMTDGSEWLTHLDLLDPEGKPREFNVTIESVKGGVVVGDGGKKSKKPVLRFKGAKKPLAAGATICKTIEKITGSADPKDWIGQRITLYVTTTEITKIENGSARRETVGCIRVRPTAPRGPDQALPTAPATEMPGDTEAPPATEGGGDGAR